jgi:hypothetical protein
MLRYHACAVPTLKFGSTANVSAVVVAQGSANGAVIVNGQAAVLETLWLSELGTVPFCCAIASAVERYTDVSL